MKRFSEKNLDELLEHTAVIDTETTGVYPRRDECVQVSIICGDGRVLLDTLVRPVRHEVWPEAEAVNGISPEIVKNAPTFEKIIPRIDKALRGITLIVGYNLFFDTQMLRGCGYDFPETVKRFKDVMEPFARVYGEWNAEHWNYKWQKLATCAAYYGFEKRYAPTGIDFHNSLFDCYVTAFCFCKMLERGHLWIGGVSEKIMIDNLRMDIDKTRLDPNYSYAPHSLMSLPADMLLAISEARVEAELPPLRRDKDYRMSQDGKRIEWQMDRGWRAKYKSPLDPMLK